MTLRPHQLHSLMIGDEPGSWAAAGFRVVEGSVTVAHTVIVLAGTEQGRGILAARVGGIGQGIDGMPFGEGPFDKSAPTSGRTGDAHESHPNGVTEVDHLVAMSPDMDRTIAALQGAGVDHRRSRTFEAGGRTRRQAFFWLGDVVLELAGDDVAQDEGPAMLWGVAFTCADLAETSALLGERLGTPRPAVQVGRDIATVRTRDLDISVPIVVMSPRP